MKAHIILYSKPDCHLCDEMKQQIAAADCDELFVLEQVDIESDPELTARFRFDIPVLFINGKQAFRHRLTPDEFKAAIQVARQPPFPHR